MIFTKMLIIMWCISKYHNTWRGKVILQLMLRRENLGSIRTTGEPISGRLLKATAKLGCVGTLLWSRCVL